MPGPTGYQDPSTQPLQLQAELRHDTENLPTVERRRSEWPSRAQDSIGTSLVTEYQPRHERAAGGGQ